MNHKDKRPKGERNTPRYKPNATLNYSTIPPLPAYPNLKRILRAWAATLLMTYLERHLPAPQDSPDSPLTLDCDTVCEALQTDRRTLVTTLAVLCSRFRYEEERSRAQRAGREFTTNHTRFGSIKPYSIVGSTTQTPGVTLQLRRNFAFIEALRKQAGINSFLEDPAPMKFQTCQIEPMGDHGQTAPLSASIQQLLKDSLVAGDRRSVRYPRLRKAVSEGLAKPEVLKIRQNARKRGFIQASTDEHKDA